jgi:hypothetical protein
MSNFQKVSEFVVSGVEKTINVISYPFIKSIDFLAKGWLKYELEDNQKFTEFLENALASQRYALNEYISLNKALKERLDAFEKDGESMTLKHRDWLNSEVERLTVLVRELAERNESLNESNSKLLSAGNAVAELISINKPKKRLTKKDKATQEIIDNWNVVARRWM